MKRKFLVSICFAIGTLLVSNHLVLAEGTDCKDTDTIAQCYPSGNQKKSETNDQTKSKDQAKKSTSDSQSEKTDGAVTDRADGPSTFLTFIKLILSLAVILGLIYLLYRFVSKRTKAYKSDGAIKNVGGVSVGTNRSVQLIRIGKEILVVGVGESVQLLKEISDPDIVESLLKDDTDDSGGIQKNVSKMVHWAKEQADKRMNASTQSDNGLQTHFSQQLKQLLKKRTDEVEKRLGKDSEDDDRNI